MGRVIAIGEGGKAQAPIRDDRFRDVIDWIVGQGQLDRLLLTPPCKDWDHADETRRAIHRSARHYCSCGRVTCARRHKNYVHDGRPAGCPFGGQRVSAKDAQIVRDKNGALRVQFELVDKRTAMQAVIDRYGTDPNNWPYNPRAKRLKD